MIEIITVGFYRSRDILTFARASSRAGNFHGLTLIAAAAPFSPGCMHRSVPGIALCRVPETGERQGTVG